MEHGPHFFGMCFPNTGDHNVQGSTPPHPIRGSDVYRMWSMVSQKNQGFLKRIKDKDVLQFVGNVDEPDLVNIEAKDVSSSTQKFFRLQFADPDNDDKVYMIIGEKESGKPVVKLKHVRETSSTPNEGKFEAIPFYAFTMFRCYSVDGETDLYLASDRDGKVLLMNGGIIRYPNPALLFIANQVI